MLKRFAILTATLAAVAVSLVGAQEAWAANPVHPAEGPSAQPTASATPGGTAHDDMAGMDHEQTAPADPEQTASADQEQMDGMSEDEMAGMDHGDKASANPSQLPGEEEEGHGGHTGTEATPVARPLAAVVGAFAAVNGAVLVVAGLMRRRDKRLAGNSPKSSRSAK